MSSRLSKKPPNLLIGSMLFGLFFGAGNLIFPVSLGQLSGQNVLYSTIGFLITATGIPFLGIMAMGLTDSKNTLEFAGRVSKPFGYFFTILLYLTIGPLFALPRTATVSFEVGLTSIVSPSKQRLVLLIFTIIFFAVALAFSLKPAKILDWIGRILNPIFLVLLFFLIIKAVISPMGSIESLGAAGNSKLNSFSGGFIGGYNTMDALASLAFGCIVIDTIKKFDITSPKDFVKSVCKSGLVSVILMCAIYASLTWLGATSINIIPVSPNGGIALFEIFNYYLGPLGSKFLAATITIACLKTAIGLITSCSKVFADIFPKSFSYNTYAVLFSVFSCFVANFGLNRIIEISIPMLMFLYPLTISLIFLGLTENFFNKSSIVYKSTIIGAFIVAIGDCIKTLPLFISEMPLFSYLLKLYSHIPFFNIGLGWVIPTLIGFLVGLIIKYFVKKPQEF